MTDASGSKVLAQVMPAEFTGGEYHDTPAYKLRDVPVIAQYLRYGGTGFKPWPGKQKNVHAWVVLNNGKAVGWNEGPQGWSFPVIAYRETP